MLQLIRKYGKRFASLSLAIFVLPMFSIICENCVIDFRSEQSTSTQISQVNVQAETSNAECKHAASDGTEKRDHTGECCDIKSADSNVAAIEYFDQVKKVIFVSQLPEPKVLAQILVLDRKFLSPNLAHAKLSFRNPVLLS